MALRPAVLDAAIGGIVMPKSRMMTRSQMSKRLDAIWVDLHEAKTRYVNACSRTNRMKYLKQVNVLEKQHMDLWGRFTDGDYMPDKNLPEQKSDAEIIKRTTFF